MVLDLMHNTCWKHWLSHCLCTRGHFKEYVLLLEIEAILWRVQNIQLSLSVVLFLPRHTFTVTTPLFTYILGHSIRAVWFSVSPLMYNIIILPPTFLVLLLPPSCCSNPLWGWVTPHPTLSVSPPLVLLLPLSSFAYLTLQHAFGSAHSLQLLRCNPPHLSLSALFLPHQRAAEVSFSRS